VGIVRGSIKQ